MKKLMIYGATGYTGRLAATYAIEAGLDIVIASRDGAALAELAGTLRVEGRAFALDDSREVADALRGVDVLLNCAGPFHRTARPLIEACIAGGIHYLDIAAELDSYRLAQELDARAKSAGVMLMPGSGGSVAMLGCVAHHALARVLEPHTIKVALRVAGAMSRGSALSASENMAECLARISGRLVKQNPHAMRAFDFGEGPLSCFPVTLPDLITLWRDTRVPNIQTFVHVSGNAFPEGDLNRLPDGPGAAEREQNRYQVSIEVLGLGQGKARAVLDTVNGYSFTPMAAASAAQRVLAGEIRPGFQTPTGMFGAGFALGIADTTISDM